jgi:flagellar hook assembly protein FlgD
MQYQQRPTSARQRRSSRRGTQQTQFTPSTLVTAISIGAVVLILVVTFVADWMRLPELSASAPSLLLSPNGDGSYDLFTVNYHLGDNASITAIVYSGSAVVRTLAKEQSQTAGDHFLTWDGRTDSGTVTADGTYRIEIIAGGAMRSTSQSVSTQVDTQPPVIQIANLPDGMQVNKSNLTLEGITEPGAIVFIGGTSQPLRVDNSGRFSFQYKLNDGDNTIDLQATDAAGNTTRVKRVVGLVTAPPDIELTRPLDNEWTNQQLLTIEGTTRPGATLEINNQTVKVNADGSFQHQMILDQGDTTLHFVATDTVGNIATLDRIVHLKMGAATIQLNVADGATVADPNLQLVGKVEPGSQVTVNGQAVAVSVLGDFQVITPLNIGDNTINIQSRDQAGNITTLTRRVIYSSGGSDGLSRLSRNLDQFPVLIVPSVLIMAGILAFIYLRQNRVTLGLSVDQPIFSPGGFGDDNVLAISLDLSKTARVSLEVLDQQGNPRATILYNRRKMGRRHVFYWNGYDDRGLALAPGDYTLQAEAGAPPLQVTSAVQIRIERQSVMQVQSPNYVRGGTMQK